MALFQLARNFYLPAHGKHKIRSIFTELHYDSLSKSLIAIRDREFLPGSKSINMPEYVANKSHEELKIVQTERNCENIETMAKLTRKFIEENINKAPALLFKGLPLKTVQDYNSFAQQLKFKKRDNVGGSAFRQQHGSHVYAASDEPASFSIEPHNELSYLENSPRQIMFFCLQAAEHGGESPIVFNRDLNKNIDKSIAEKLARKKIKYSRNLKHEDASDYVTWQTTFGAKTKKEAEQRMKEQCISGRWNDDGSLTIWNIVPAVRSHPVTGETLFFNQAHASHSSYYYAHPDYVGKQHLKPNEVFYHCTYGDGEEIENEVLDHIRSVTWKSAIGLKLEPGDVIFLDNFLVQHSRMSFVGNRKIFAHMIN